MTENVESGYVAEELRENIKRSLSEKKTILKPVRQKPIDVVAVKQAVRDGELSLTMRAGAVLLKDETSGEAVLIPVQKDVYEWAFVVRPESTEEGIK